MPTNAPAPQSGSPAPTPAPTGNVDPTKAVVNPTAPTKDAPKPEPKKFKLNIDGKEEELSETDIINMRRKAAEAEKRFQAAAEIQRKYDMPIKQAQALIKALTQGDPSAVFELPEVQKNPKLLEAMEKLVWKQYQQKQMSPEQLEIQKKLQRAEELERIEQQRQADAKKLKEAEESKLALQRLDKQITEILQNAKVPKTKYTVSQVARLMQAAANRKQAYNPELIARTVENLYKDSNNFYAESLQDDQALVDYLGPKVVERVRKYLVEKYNLKKKEKSASTPPSPKREVKDKRKLTWDEWRAQQAGK